MHSLAQKVRQAWHVNMGQNLYSVRVVAQKVEDACENKVLVFLFMFHGCFYACACQVHDCDFFVSIVCFYLQAKFYSSKMP